MRTAKAKFGSHPPGFLPPAVTLEPAALAAPSPEETAEEIDAKITELLGGPKVFRQRLMSLLATHELLRTGLPARAVGSLFNRLSVLGPADPAMARVLGTSLRTMQRQKKTPDKRLSQEQSGRLWKFAEILAKATEVFGSQRDAEQWMQRPATGLEQKRPIDLLETPAGMKIVETFLGRIEYGVYT